jgi:hypothetical protein
MRIQVLSSLTVALCLAAGLVSKASASVFTSFVIRNDGGGNPPQILPNNVYVAGATEFVISAGGMKAGWGSNDLSGATLGQVTNIGITRHDNSGRFAGGSGPAVAPYFNFWVTDGTNYAVIGNEPSNGSFGAFRTSIGGGGFSYSFSINDIGAEPAKVYETAGALSQTSWVHVALNKVGQNLTFNDVAGLMIGAPSPSYIAAGNGIGSGAPRELGTNIAQSFTWMFGDTLSNYVSGNEGYVVSGASAIPAPGSLALLGLGGLMASRRRRA